MMRKGFVSGRYTTKKKYSGKKSTGRKVRSLRMCPMSGIRPSFENSSKNSFSILFASLRLSEAMVL